MGDGPDENQGARAGGALVCEAGELKLLCDLRGTVLYREEFSIVGDRSLDLAILGVRGTILIPDLIRLSRWLGRPMGEGGDEKERDKCLEGVDVAGGGPRAGLWVEEVMGVLPGLLLGPSQTSPRPVMRARGEVKPMAGLNPSLGAVEAVVVLELNPSLGAVGAVVVLELNPLLGAVEAVVVQLVLKHWLGQRCFSRSSFLSLVAQDPVPAHSDASERGGGVPSALSSHLCTGVGPFP